ncbi:MAG: TIGR00180 family glycosyltransferase [Alphaproteobacteria bacterium]|nr:TIGR00180 family glycosyltransferase [Alphaproteobacteria bacterium]
MQRVTLLIPTFNRSHFLTRQLDYLARHFSADFYAIRILDGSNQEHEREKNRTLATANNVEYGWWDSALVAGYQRLIAGCELVETDYVQLVPDDDYFSQTAMRRHVEILDEHSDAVAAYGHTIAFREMNNAGDQNYHLQVRLPTRENLPDYTFDHPISNIFYSMFERSRAAYYCLYRRDVLLKSLRVAQESSVLVDAGSRNENDSLIDSRCYYFGDLAMTMMPLILGKKINSGLPSVGYQVGQSFDKGASAKEHKVPERLPHHRLLLDPSFEFAVRARKYIDCLVSEYSLAHPGSDAEALDGFLTHVTMAFFGTMAANSVLLRTYNQAGKRLGVPGRMRLRAVQNVSKASEILELSQLPDSGSATPRGEVIETKRIIRDYQFLTDEISRFYKSDRLEVVTVGNIELELAQMLFSFERPTPYGVKPKPNAKTGEPRSNKTKAVAGAKSRYGLARAVARRLLPKGFRRG